MEKLSVFMKQLACVEVGTSNHEKKDVIAQANVEGSMGTASFLIDLWNLRSRINDL